MTNERFPTLAQIQNARDKLGNHVVETPIWRWQGDFINRVLGSGTGIFLKLELFQYTGSFKPRGALTRMRSLSPERLSQGVTAVSAGNHAAAVGYAARVLGTTAKVVMPAKSNPARVELCKSYGAEVVLVEDVHTAFETVKQIEANEARTFIHPFDGLEVAQGTGTLGLELCHQCRDLDAVVIPIGGGGLCAGVSAAVKQITPKCKVFGVEPFGADTMYRSFKAGHPESIPKVNTIADSLGAPFAEQYSFEICRRYVDDLVRIDDDSLCEAMYLLFSQVKLAVEPAGAASTAALLGPLRSKLGGKNIGLVVCGANIDSGSFSEYLKQGEQIFRSREYAEIDN